MDNESKFALLDELVGLVTTYVVTESGERILDGSVDEAFAGCVWFEDDVDAVSAQRALEQLRSRLTAEPRDTK